MGKGEAPTRLSSIQRMTGQQPVSAGAMWGAGGVCVCVCVLGGGGRGGGRGYKDATIYKLVLCAQNKYIFRTRQTVWNISRHAQSIYLNNSLPSEMGKLMIG